VGSSIVGANNVNIVATGGGADSNIRAVGSTIAAGNTVNMAADNAIRLEASKNTWAQQGTNKSSGTSIGVGYAAGAQNGFTIELGMSQGKGKDDGSEVSYNNTHVSGGKAVNVTSGGDLPSRAPSSMHRRSRPTWAAT
jgi:filamentous hemagglutinin